MPRLRFSIVEFLALLALGGVLVLFQRHVHYQATTREIIWAIELSPDETMLARASDLGVTLFDLSSCKATATIKTAAGAIAFSPDSKLLALGGIGGSVEIWDLVTGTTRPLPSHTGWVRSVAFSPDGTRLCTASRDGTARIWDVASGNTLATIRSRAGGLESAAFSPDGKLLATGAANGAIRRHDIELWDARTGAPSAVLAGPDYCYVEKLAFSPDGNILASGLSVPVVRLWDISAGKATLTFPNAIGRRVVSFSPSGRLFVTTMYENTFGLTYAPDRGEGAERGCPHNWGCGPQAVGVWDTGTGARMSRLDGRCGNGLAVRFSPDESTLVMAGDDGSVVTWNLATGRETGRVTGLTLRPGPVPFRILAGFGVWLVVWLGLAFRTARRSSAGRSDRTATPYILMALVATYSVANGVLLVVGISDISGLFGLAAWAFAVLIGVVACLGLRSVRSRPLLWALGAVLVACTFVYDLSLLGEAIAGV